ncbi:MAG: CehA/McbA family metallohydrolase [Anaerolineae bacterium]|nr:CehA/McbA family metallohydrolase [Anaerolineae bacterium]
MTGRADLHVHTTYSDGVSSVPEVLEAAVDAGLDAIAITDHDTIEGALEATVLGSAYRIETIVGAEITTREGHLLGLFLKRLVPAGLTLAESIAAVHEQGGVAVAAHPYDPICFGVLNPWRHILTEEQVLELPYDAMEVFNACLPVSLPNRQAVRLAARAGTGRVAGSDAHSADTVGLGVTEFPGTTAEELRAALHSRQTAPSGKYWTTRQYLSLFRQRELRTVGVAAGYAAGLAGAVVGVAAMAVRSGVGRFV